MRKRLVFSVLGFGVVFAVLKSLAKESQKLVAQNSTEEFWHWLSGVWEEYTVLHGYVRDNRFSNSVSDKGVEEALARLEHELLHYPEEILKSFGKDFERESSKLRAEAFLHVLQIKNCLLKNYRTGINAPVELLGEVLTNFNDLGDKKRQQRMLTGVGWRG